VFFGEDVTERFCTLNGISLVVRSHECVPEGKRRLGRTLVACLLAYELV
jgi:hypothetical protein